MIGKTQCIMAMSILADVIMDSTLDYDIQLHVRVNSFISTVFFCVAAYYAWQAWKEIIKQQEIESRRKEGGPIDL